MLEMFREGEFETHDLARRVETGSFEKDLNPAEAAVHSGFEINRLFSNPALPDAQRLYGWNCVRHPGNVQTTVLSSEILDALRGAVYVC